MSEGRDFQGNKVMKDNVKWQNYILYGVAAFIIIWHIGGGIFGGFGVYGLATKDESFLWKILGLACDAGVVGALLFAANRAKDKGGQFGAIIVAFGLLVLATFAYAGFSWPFKF